MAGTRSITLKAHLKLQENSKKRDFLKCGDVGKPAAVYQELSRLNGHNSEVMLT
jgi:hypothetical protein